MNTTKELVRATMEAPEDDGRPMLVGELNPYGPRSVFALWPSPPNCAGHRLCHKVMGLDPEDYLRRFRRANLCVGRWSLPAARQEAGLLVTRNSHRPTTFVLLGRKVADAFEPMTGRLEPFTSSERLLMTPGSKPCTFIALPHPSGRCLAWNEPGAPERARELLRAGGLLP